MLGLLGSVITDQTYRKWPLDKSPTKLAAIYFCAVCYLTVGQF